MWRFATMQADEAHVSARCRRDEQGYALLLVMILAVLVSGFVGAALPLSFTETRAASHARDVVAWKAAAEGALDAVLGSLEPVGSWNDLLAGAVRGPVFVPVGLDLAAATAEVERKWGTLLDRGPDTPRWTLVGAGPADHWFGNTAAGVPGATLAVWVADDGADGDGDPFRDNNGRILVHAEALAATGGRASTTALVERSGPAPRPTRRVAWWAS